jgi:Asp-tRNA(Asn)/Glu-tRNA(Gln) amidotransferase A subunit family amidase
MNEPLTVTAAAPRIRSGELTPSELLEQCLRRIDIYEPAVKAWVYLDRERARQEAEELTKEIQAGNYRGELHGIPVGIKDIIDVFDMPTGCGSKLWANSYARQDGECVKRLRQAGALILGKTVTTAYAFTDPPVTRNPWNLDRTPGGSSSGSAAAVACGMCLAALGTQTGGSLTRPASYCGVCSLKPAYERISVEGVLPLAPSLDHVGVIAGCVQDLSHVYRVIAGPMDYVKYGGIDPYDPLPVGRRWNVMSTRQPPRRSVHLQFTDDFFPDRCTPEVRERFADFMSGWMERDLPDDPFRKVILPPAYGLVPDAHLAIMASEAAEYHRARIRRHPDDYPPNITALIERGLRTSAAELTAARRLRSEMAHELRQFDKPVGLVTPATTDLPPTPETTGNPVFNAVWNFLGLPTVSLPYAVREDGLSFALQIVGEHFTEDGILRYAASLEEHFALLRRLPPVPVT